RYHRPLVALGPCAASLVWAGKPRRCGRRLAATDKRPLGWPTGKRPCAPAPPVAERPRRWVRRPGNGPLIAGFPGLARGGFGAGVLWIGLGLFFYADIQLGAGLFDDLLTVLLGEVLVLVVTLDGLLDLWDFVLGQIAAAVFAFFPGVEVVVGTVGALADNREGAVLHALDLEDTFDEGLRCERCIHGHSIDIHLYHATKNGANQGFEEMCRAHPTARTHLSSRTLAWNDKQKPTPRLGPQGPRRVERDTV